MASGTEKVKRFEEQETKPVSETPTYEPEPWTDTEPKLKESVGQKEAEELALNQPWSFLTYHELMDKFPDLTGIAMDSLTRKAPHVYFLSKYYKEDKYKKYNEQALYGLLSKRPDVYFNIGLYNEPEFSKYKKSAAFATAHLEPKFFLDVVLKVMPEFKDLRHIAEEKLRRKESLAKITVRKVKLGFTKDELKKFNSLIK